MISHCANPVCGKSFHYFSGGRLYRFQSPGPEFALQRRSQRDLQHKTFTVNGVFLAVRAMLQKVLAAIQLSRRIFAVPLADPAVRPGRAPVIAVER